MSTERALKELIDNTWDADAEQVNVSLPPPMSGQPIIIEDNGSGMTQEEISRHYLLIASDRIARSGERTAIKNRKVKGKKGIDKFSGLMAASVMQLETWARGSYCTFTLKIEDLNKVDDIEQLQLPIKIQDYD